MLLIHLSAYKALPTFPAAFVNPPCSNDVKNNVNFILLLHEQSKCQQQR